MPPPGDHVDMRVMGHGRAPGVEHGGDADAGAQDDAERAQLIDRERLVKLLHAVVSALTREISANPSRTQFKGNRAWALEMHAKAMAATTPEFRRARASLAAKVANEKRRRLREAAAEARG
jgi:hypothetical protein